MVVFLEREFPCLVLVFLFFFVFFQGAPVAPLSSI